MEQHIFFNADNIKLEGLVSISSKKKGVVITHPHSLYGGDMYNNVVDSIAKIYQQKSCTTLRFNFRGVGKSQGEFGDGTGETIDVHGALAYMKSLSVETISLVGYSFGSWVNALTQYEPGTINEMVMVAPPVAFLDFSMISVLSDLTLVIMGDRDDFSSTTAVESSLSKWNLKAHLEIIHGADHFFSGFQKQLEDVLAVHVK